MKTVSVLKTFTMAILRASIFCPLLIVFCHSAKGLDTISSIQGTHPKPHPKAIHRLHTASRSSAPRKTIVTHRLFRHSTSPLAMRTIHQRKVQPVPYSVQAKIYQPILAKPAIGNAVVLAPTHSASPVFSPANIPLKGPVFFVDDFSNPSRTQQLWGVLPGGGTLKFGRGNISLKDNTADFNVWPGETPQFPHVRLKINPFPASGDWRCSFIYSYNKGSNRLNSSGISIFRADNTRLAYIYQDGNGQGLMLNDKVFWSSSQCNRHEISLRKTGNTVSVSVDGVQSGQGLMGNSPTTIELGGTYQNETNWSNFDLNYLQIDDTSMPEPINGNNRQYQSSQPDSQTTIFTDSFQSPEQSRKNWSINENGGSVRFQQGAMCLKDDPPGYDTKLAAQGNHFDHSGFPLVKLLQNPFPTNRNWKLQFILNFNSSGSPNADGFLILRDDGSPLLAVGQDNSGEYAYLNNKGVWRAGAMSGSHTVTLENQDDRVNLSIDGTAVGNDYIYKSPTTLQLGGSLKHGSQGWNNFDLQSISIMPE